MTSWWRWCGACGWPGLRRSSPAAQAANALRALLVTAPAELRQQLRSLPVDRLARAAAQLRPGPIVTPAAAAKLALRQLCGVGPEIAGALLAAAGDNPERLRSEAAFSMLCGASPIEASSGKTVRHRPNRDGNRQANTALYRIVEVFATLNAPTGLSDVA